MTRRVAISQSNYIPWKGYFDTIDGVDEFVLLDEVQYTRRDWRNRNRVLIDGTARWLTLPVAVKGNYHQRIDETRVARVGWNDEHLRTVQQAYARAPHADWALELLAPLWRGATQELLSEVNRRFLDGVCAALDITTPLRSSTEFTTRPEPSERLLDICLALDADTYVSGPAARAYLREDLFADAGVAVEYATFDGYREYDQLTTLDFRHDVSIVDLLFMTGPQARGYAVRADARRPRQLG